MPGTLKVTREGFGIELRRGHFDIVVDGASVGSVEYGQTVEVPVDPGRRAVRIRAGRYSSAERAVEVEDRQVVSFRCHGAMIWMRWLASFAVPGLAISLRRT